MKNISKLLGILFVFAIAFSSCSKEKKLTRNLTKNGGEWRIVSHVKKEYNLNSNEPHKTDVLAENQGSFVFDDSGEFSYTFYSVITEGMFTVRGTWSNTEDEISTSMEGMHFKYKILDQSKKGLRLEAEEVYDYEKTVYSLELERR